MDREEHPDWKLRLAPDSRLRITRKILETLKRHLPFSCPEGLLELTRIAVRFEGKIYTTAYSQSDYLRKISLKMLTMETRPPHNNDEVADPLPLVPPNPVDMDDTRWQNQFQVDSRRKIFSKILDTSMKYLPLCGPEQFLEATEFAVRFEESVFTTAADETDYLHKISLKILSMEVNSENSNVNL